MNPFPDADDQHEVIYKGKVIPELPANIALFRPARDGYYVFFRLVSPANLTLSSLALDVDPELILRVSQTKSQLWCYIVAITLDAATQVVQKLSSKDYTVLEHAEWALQQWESEMQQKRQALDTSIQKAKEQLEKLNEEEPERYTRCWIHMEEEGLTKLQTSRANLKSPVEQGIEDVADDLDDMPWPEALKLSIEQALKDLKEGNPIIIDDSRNYSVVYEDGSIIGATWDPDVLVMQHDTENRDTYLIEPLGVVHHRCAVTAMRVDPADGNALYMTQTLRNPQRPALMITHECLCDTGSEDTSIFRNELSQINPPPRNLRPRSRHYFLANGARVRQRAVRVEARMEDSLTGTPITG